MKGFIRQRGDAWELRVFLGYDVVTGKQRYAYRTVHGGKREAQRTLAEMITDADKGLAVRTNASVGDLLEAWFEMAAPGFSPKTAMETRGLLDRSLLPAFGRKQLAKLSVAQIDAFYGRLRQSGGARGQGLAPGTIRRIHGVLRRALGQSVKWGWLPINPAAAASPPRVPQPEITPPSPEQLGRILGRARDESPELAAYLLLSAATGARRSEVIALRWRDLDLDDAVATFARGIVIVNGGLVEKDTKTCSSRRVALDSGTVAAMVEHHHRMTERANACGHEIAGDWFVFTNQADGTVPWFPASGLALDMSLSASAAHTARGLRAGVASDVSHSRRCVGRSLPIKTLCRGQRTACNRTTSLWKKAPVWRVNISRIAECWATDSSDCFFSKRSSNNITRFPIGRFGIATSTPTRTMWPVEEFRPRDRYDEYEARCGEAE